MWNRNCPKCGKEHIYKTERNLLDAEIKQRICRSCSKTGRTLSDETKSKMRQSHLGEKNIMWKKHHTPETIEKIRKLSHFNMLGKKHSVETKRKMSENNVGFKGRHHSNATRLLMKKKRVEYLSKSLSRTSKSATKFLDELETRWASKIQREVPIGGRVFDGKVGNLLIEVDGVFWHSTPEQKEIDAEKDSIASQHGYRLSRYIVNKESDIPGVLQKIRGEQP